MGVSLDVENFTELFNFHLSKDPVIINDFADLSDADRNAFNSLIYTRFNNDLLSNLPSCECGEITEEHNLGVLCSVCNTVVKSPNDNDLEPIVWMRSPKGVADLINPIIWTMLKDKFTRSGFEIIRWLCDTSYRPPVRTPPIMEAVLGLGIPRGYNNFVANFDKIMEALFDLKGFRPKKGTVDQLQELLKVKRDCIFSKHLPLPNRALLVIEETNVGTYIDPIITGAVDAIRTMVSIDTELSSHSVRAKENRTIKSIAQLAEYCDGLYSTTLAKKEGLCRKHVFGGRVHFSFRGVISSLTDKHKYDEIHIPWIIGVTLLSLHLSNKLLKLGMTPVQIRAYLYKHSYVYSELLDSLFQELINETPGGKGIPVVFQRNPSLGRGLKKKWSLLGVILIE